MRNGGGSSIGQIGDGVWLHWGSQEAADYSDECPGANFWAYGDFATRDSQI